MQVNIQGISKKYGRSIVLDEVGFEASSGDCVCIIGRNGCGKSTLLSILAQVIPADNGYISFGSNITIGYLPQVNPLIERVSVRDNLKLFCKDASSFEYAVERFELDNILGKNVKTLSGGMKRRLALACAMANKPHILIMDEATAALDIEYKAIIRNEMQEYMSGGGIIIMASHEREEIDMSTVCYELSEGHLHLRENI